MKTPLFLKNKLHRLLDIYGVCYNFTLMGVDSYNQPKEESNITIKGIYHESNSFISLSTSDSATVQRKKSPMILTVFDENTKKLKQGDKVYINSVGYKISGLLDIQNYGVGLDISLEMEV